MQIGAQKPLTKNVMRINMTNDLILTNVAICICFKRRLFSRKYPFYDYPVKVYQIGVLIFLYYMSIMLIMHLQVLLFIKVGFFWVPVVFDFRFYYRENPYLVNSSGYLVDSPDNHRYRIQRLFYF